MLTLVGVGFCFAMIVLSREGEVWWMGREVSDFIFGYQTRVHLENADSSDSSGEKSSVDFRLAEIWESSPSTSPLHCRD